MDISKLKELQNHFETGRASTPEAQQLYKQSEELIFEFQQKFSIAKLRSLTLDEYVEGHKSKDSFCYWLEHTTDPVGKFMPGGSGYGFNVYYSQTKNAYVIQEGNQGKTVSVEEANKRLELIKAKLIELLEVAKEKNFDEIRRISKELPLDQHTIGKILSLYYPDKYLSLFSNRHMDEYLNRFGLLDPKTKALDSLEKREILLSFKMHDEIMKNWSPRKYVDFLYKEILGKQAVETDISKISFWKFSPGSGASLWTEFKKHSVISMGSWGTPGLDLNKWKTRDELLAANGSVSYRAAGELWTFKEIKRGDIVVAYGNKSIYDFGIVDSDYQFDDKDSVTWWASESNARLQGKQQWRTVNWLQLFQSPVDISNDIELYNDLKKTGTIHKINATSTKKLLNLTGEQASELLRLSAEAAGKIKVLSYETSKSVPTIHEIVKDIESKGFYFPAETIQNFHTCLLTKPFVILSGKTGTGKTKLVELYSNAIHRANRDNRYYKKISVQPNWNDNKPLLGYYNPFMQEYNLTPFLKFMLQAIDDCKSCKQHGDGNCSDKAACTLKYFVCLDEMNLAHVEYYFADFISAMETEDKTIDLHSEETHSQNGTILPCKIRIPDNFFVIGTVNVDETTKEFSPKVLDRANTLDMDIIDLDKWREIQLNLGVNINETAFKVIKEVHQSLKKYGLHFGYRVCSEIMKYLEYSSLELEKSIDFEIKQKILPKLCGDDNPKLRGSLEELRNYLSNTKYELSRSKVENMLAQLNTYGFTTFYE